MKQSRFTEAQIIGILKEQESGSPTAEVCRKRGISTATFNKYKARIEPIRVCTRLIFVNYAAMGSVVRPHVFFTGPAQSDGFVALSL